MKKLENFINLTVKDLSKVKGGATGAAVGRPSGPTSFRTSDCTNVYEGGEVIGYDYCDDRD